MTYADHFTAPRGLTFKAAFGFASVAIAVIGALVALAGQSYPFWLGVVAGLAGGLVGVVIARRASSDHRR